MTKEEMRMRLIALSLKNKGDWEKTNSDLENNVEPSNYELEDAEISLNRLKEDGPWDSWHCVTILDDDYPECFKKDFPPFVFFYYGDLRELQFNNCKILSDTENSIDDGDAKDYPLYITECYYGQMERFRMLYLKALIEKSSIYANRRF